MHAHGVHMRCTCVHMDAHGCTWMHMRAHARTCRHTNPPTGTLPNLSVCTWMHMDAHTVHMQRTWSAHGCTCSAHACTRMHMHAHATHMQCTCMHIHAHACTCMHMKCTWMHMHAHGRTQIHPDATSFPCVHLGVSGGYPDAPGCIWLRVITGPRSRRPTRVLSAFDLDASTRQETRKLRQRANLYFFFGCISRARGKRLR